MKSYFVYILECADKTYYTGITNNLESRIAQHTGGYVQTCYTFKRRPLILRYSIQIHDVNQAIALEKQIKKWNRDKKDALIKEQWSLLKLLSKSNVEQNFGKPGL